MLLGEDLRGEESLGEVIDPEVALPPADPEDPGLGEALEDGPDLVGRAPVPVDRLARADVAGQQRAAVPDPPEELLDEGCVLVEGAAFVPRAHPVPDPAIERELGDGHDVEALVVGLVQAPVLVQPVVGPLAAVAGDTGEQHQVVVATGHLERVELQ